jgi:NAD(P)-dependent dehydrogenase (short-subunit alcohol dehydrogenase family)
MENRVCLVTGGTSGVGRSIALGCARAGATVIIVGRDAARGEAAEKQIRAASGNERVEWLAADMADLSSVRDLASAIQKSYGSLHVLSINAAALAVRRELTREGFERILATNYLGHFLLTNLLLDSLRASAPSRVIAASGHPATLTGVRLDLNDLMLEHGFSYIRATVRAAMAKVLFMFELARRMQGTGVTANTFHPGIVRSGLPSHLPLPLRIPATAVMFLVPRKSATGIYLATSSEVEGVTGAFFVGKRPAGFTPGYDVMDVAGRLWSASARLVGLV